MSQQYPHGFDQYRQQTDAFGQFPQQGFAGRAQQPQQFQQPTQFQQPQQGFQQPQQPQQFQQPRQGQELAGAYGRTPRATGFQRMQPNVGAQGGIPQQTGFQQPQGLQPPQTAQLQGIGGQPQFGTGQPLTEWQTAQAAQQGLSPGIQQPHTPSLGGVPQGGAPQTVPGGSLAGGQIPVQGALGGPGGDPLGAGGISQGQGMPMQGGSLSPQGQTFGAQQSTFGAQAGALGGTGNPAGFEGSTTVDVIDMPDEVSVFVDLPGIEQEDIQIQADGNNLTILAKRREEHEEDETVFQRERPATIRRTVTLPVRADVEEAEATYENGVCKITLPKMEEEKQKQIGFQ